MGFQPSDGTYNEYLAYGNHHRLQCKKREQTPEAVINQATQVSLADPESAAILCNQVTRSYDIDLCFSQIALSSQRSVLCESVQDEGSRDSCYMSFAQEGDFSVCTQVKNNYLSKACNSLKRASSYGAGAQQIAQEQNITFAV